MDPILHTPRLTLVRLTDTTPDSQHVQWFHENWSSASATAWSLQGASKSRSESRARMIEHLAKWDTMFYAVFARPREDGGDGEKHGEQGVWYRGTELGRHLGSVSLRLQAGGATLAPGRRGSEKRLRLRVIGYALFEEARGRGYATEANRAMLDAYRASVAGEMDAGEELFYIEGAVDEGNPGSAAVLKKLGFEQVGWKEEEPVWLNGEWRSGYWVYGMYL